MIKGVILASYAYFEGGEIGDFLNYLDQAGFFSYLLPFLLIFALVFGILTQIGIFQGRDRGEGGNKAINGIIALVVSLMSLQFEFVPRFFAEIFPRFGIGITILLIIIIFVGMFIDPETNGLMYVFMAIGGIIVIIVLIQTAGEVGWSAGYWWEENWPMVAGIIFILVVLAIIVGAGGGRRGKHTNKSPFAEALRESMR